MKAVNIGEFGNIDSVELRDAVRPQPEKGEVLVRVAAFGLNRADLLQVLGKYPPPPGYSPNMPGLEFAGEVVETDPGVTNVEPGDRVFGITSGESQAEFLVSHAELLMPIPESLSYEQAAAIPEVFITAHDAVVTQCGLSAGETILIHAVGSGVGLAALQIAKAVGAKTIGTSRTADKLEKCIDLGLDHGIVVGSPAAFADQASELANGGANVILDLVGGSYFEENVRALSMKGRMIVVGLTGGSVSQIDLGLVLRKRANIRSTFLRARPTDEKAAATAAFAADILPLIAKGAIKPNIDKVYGADSIVDAYKYLASNESFGKIVVKF